MNTPPLSPQEIRDVVQGWREGNTMEEIMSLLIRNGKPRTERFLTRLFMGVIHQDKTGLTRSETLVEAKIRYSHRRKDVIFGDEVL